MVSFKNLVDLLRRRDDIAVEVVDFSDIRRRKGTSVRGMLCLCGSVLAKVRRMDVITVYFAPTGLPTLGLLLLVISRVLRKPFVIRTGGCDYMDSGSLKERLGQYIIKCADLYLGETQALVRLARERGIAHSRWYPTSRPMDATKQLSWGNDSCRRFVYIGHVRESKGMRVLAEVAMRLPRDVTIDLYGPWFDDLARCVFDGISTVRYQGEIAPGDVVATMRKYDAAVLPSKAVTEGYPGMVIESYVAGLPIVASRIGGIPEIVDDTVGILVEPDKSEDLLRAMMRLIEDDVLFQQLRSNTETKAMFFSSERWGGEFVRFCQNVYAGKRTIFSEGDF